MSPFAPRLDPPYYAVVFTSQRSEVDEDYEAMAAHMMALAAQQPGYLGVESAPGGGWPGHHGVVLAQH